MPLRNEQSRQVIDVGHVFSALREARHDHVRNYRYAARWRTINSRDYLYIGEKSHGPRNIETENRFANYEHRRSQLKERIGKMEDRLAQMAPVNRALRLGRVPLLPARILRAFDDEGLLGPSLRVIGTHALFAYEIAAGEFFQADLLATNDLDLCWDAKERLSILAADGTQRTVLSVLKRVDRSFDAGRLYGFSAQNDENFIVDLIAPRCEDSSPATGIDGDMAASPILEVASLIGDAFSAMAFGEDGLPVQIVCPLPDAMAAHKRVISQSPGRKPLQRRRDLAQAEAIEGIAPVLNATGAMFREPAAH